jgi:HPt (histidine-containing phosphotransfer) domain-containing protein
MNQQYDPDDERDAVPAELLPLVGGFLERRITDVSVLREAVKNNDFGTVKLLGHRLKGNGAGFGFPSLSRLGAELEASGSASDRTSATDLINNLEILVERYKRDNETA